MTDNTQKVGGPRERFQKWVLSTEHPVYGWLDGHWLRRGDDREGYANEYVQGLWVAFKAFAAPAEDVRAVVEEPVGFVSGLALRNFEKGLSDELYANRHALAHEDPVALFGHSQRQVVFPERLREVWLFLDGQAELNGCVFGETPEGRKNFWWRKELREAIEAVEELNK